MGQILIVETTSCKLSGSYYMVPTNSDKICLKRRWFSKGHFVVKNDKDSALIQCFCRPSLEAADCGSRLSRLVTHRCATHRKIIFIVLSCATLGWPNSSGGFYHNLHASCVMISYDWRFLSTVELNHSQATRVPVDYSILRCVSGCGSHSSLAAITSAIQHWRLQDSYARSFYSLLSV